MESVAAEVALEPSGEAVVELRLQIRVRGGWLEALEVAGLDEDYVLDEESVVFASEEGSRFSPQVRAREDGRVSFGFRRRSAPRRGRYRASLRYRTNLAGRSTRPLEGGRVHVEWTLPGWRSGLDGVSVAFVAPGGSRFTAEESTRASIETDEQELPDGRRRLSWRRAHLPRTVPWTVAIEVPGEAMDEALSQRATAPPPPEQSEGPSQALERAEVAEARPLLPMVVAALMALLCVVSIWTFDAEAKRRGATAVGVLPLPKVARVLLVLSAGVAAGATANPTWWLGLLGAMALVVLERQTMARAPALGSWVDVNDAMRRKAQVARRLIAWRSPTDISTISGAAVALGTTLVIAFVHRQDLAEGARWFGPAQAGDLPGLVLLAIPFLTGVRRQLPLSGAERLLRLEEHGQRLASQGEFRLAVHQDAQGRWQDVRLRVFTITRPAGLLRVDLGLSSTGRLVGMVLTRTGSTAEALVASQYPREEGRVGPGGRVGRVVEPEALFGLVRVLAGPGDDEVGAEAPAPKPPALDA